MNYFKTKIIQITQSNAYKVIVSSAFLTYLAVLVIAFIIFIISGIAVWARAESMWGLAPSKAVMDIALRFMAITASGVVVTFMFILLTISLEPNISMTLDYGVNWKRDGF